MESLELFVQYKDIARLKITKARFNRAKTFWDLEGQLENGVWIPIEVEWITQNFFAHKHDKDEDYSEFLRKNGVILVLRRNKEIDTQQLSIFDNLSEAQFKLSFKKWFRGKSSDYIDQTLESYLVGSFRRDVPRIILYPLSKTAYQNYFSTGCLYRKQPSDPPLIGFKESGYRNNVFVKDLQENDICLFIASHGKRCTRDEFVANIKLHKQELFRVCGYKIKEGIFDKRTRPEFETAYWPDEVKSSELIYPYLCILEEKPFLERSSLCFPFIPTFSENTWEAFRSCIQYGEYREISSLDFTLFLSSL